MKNGLLHWISWILVVIGGLNWGIFGLLKIDIVAMILGDFSLLSRVVYILVGLAAVYLIYSAIKKKEA